MSTKPVVYVTLELPPGVIDLLTPKLEVKQWKHDTPVPREEFLRNIKGATALCCRLTDKIDKELLDAAGRFA